MFGRWLSHPSCPVELRPSLLEGAGLGVFARRDIPVGAFVTPYDGRVVPMRHGTLRPESLARYAYEMPCGGRLVPTLAAMRRTPGRASRRGLGHMLNDAVHVEATGRVNNCYFDEVDCGDGDGTVTVWVRTDSCVASGEELYVDYGPAYWAERGHRTGVRAPLLDSWCARQEEVARALRMPPLCATVRGYVGRDAERPDDLVYVVKRQAEARHGRQRRTCRCDTSASPRSFHVTVTMSVGERVCVSGARCSLCLRDVL